MDITLMAAIIAAIAAIIAPVVSSLISSRNAYKTKTAEMFFQAKVDAYLEFLYLAASYEPDPSSSYLMELQKDSSCAMLFSTSETQEKIAIYSQAIMNNDFSQESLARLSIASRDAILAMQSDLELPTLKKKRKH